MEVVVERFKQRRPFVPFAPSFSPSLAQQSGGFDVLLTRELMTSPPLNPRRACFHRGAGSFRALKAKTFFCLLLFSSPSDAATIFSSPSDTAVEGVLFFLVARGAYPHPPHGLPTRIYTLYRSAGGFLVSAKKRSVVSSGFEPSLIQQWKGYFFCRKKY